MILPARQGAEVLVANYHAPRETGLDELIAVLRRFGVERIKMQRDVFDPELYFRLLSIANHGELARMPQFKSAELDQQTGQLLTYPVLMTHDVAGYDEVLVGEDQMTHLEYARKLLKRYNRVFDADLRTPKASVVGGKVKDLRHPDKKMSKSSPDGCLFLSDAPDQIRRKLRDAVTTDAGVDNLSSLYRHFIGATIPDQNSQLKDELVDAVIRCFALPK